MVFKSTLESALQTIDAAGFWGMIAFVILYAVATVVLVPGGLLTLAAGAIFGLLWGSIVTFGGATLGATLAFLLGRYGVRDWVARRWLKDHQRLAAIDRAIGQEGWKIVFLVRLSPLFPFNAVNYMFGLTRISLRDYVLASLGMIPGTVLYVYLGSTFKTLAMLLSGEQPAHTPVQQVLFGAGLVATAVLTVYVTRLAQRSLRAATVAGAADQDIPADHDPADSGDLA